MTDSWSDSSFVLSASVVGHLLECWFRESYSEDPRHVILPLDLVAVIALFLEQTMKLRVEGHASRKLVYSGLVYSFDRVIIDRGGHLFCSRWDRTKQMNGEIKILCDVLEVSGEIEADYAGYSGGGESEGRQGESYTGLGKIRDHQPNGGGGGWPGGHAGHSERGTDSSAKGKAGLIYGDPRLTTPIRGSGGASSRRGKKSGRYSKGGNGGGIIDIEVRSRLWISHSGSISAKGEDGIGKAGCGSGGSIRLTCHGTCEINGRVNATGAGLASDGRVALHCSHHPPIFGSSARMNPLPLVCVCGEKDLKCIESLRKPDKRELKQESVTSEGLCSGLAQTLGQALIAEHAGHELALYSDPSSSDSDSDELTSALDGANARSTSIDWNSWKSG